MVAQEKLIKNELEHFYKEKEEIKKEMKDNYMTDEEWQRNRQRILMINEIIKIKEERLKEYLKQ